jgi:predicted peptidase
MCAVAFSAAAAPPAEPEARVFKNHTGKTLPYRLVAPTDGDGAKTYPIVLFLHGAGERGTDNAKQLVWFWSATKPSVLTRKEFADAKAYAVIPQCPDDQQWVNVPWAKGSYQSPPVSEPLQLTIELVESLLKEHPIDPDRVYVVGMSMGGYGAFDCLQRRPDLFAAGISICGAGDPTKAKVIADIPVWAFHGEKDPAVPVAGSRETVAALKQAGGSPKYTEYPGVGHNSWSPAFEEKEFWTWLFAQKRKK